jgi:hypothetical protein
MKKLICSIVVLALMTFGMVEASGNKGDKGHSSSGSSGKSIPNANIGKGQPADKNHKPLAKATKFPLQGNKNVAKSPGFKGDPKLHAQFLNKYKVPSYLHNKCFFHHDFCWDHTCWFPTYHTCGYWHPYTHCWYYYYEPYRCYLPYEYIQTCVPPATTVQPAVIVNVTNTNTNVNNVNTDGPPTLPVGAAAVLPTGINPIIPAPKQ